MRPQPEVTGDRLLHLPAATREVRTDPRTGGLSLSPLPTTATHSPPHPPLLGRGDRRPLGCFPFRVGSSETGSGIRVGLDHCPNSGRRLSRPAHFRSSLFRLPTLQTSGSRSGLGHLFPPQTLSGGGGSLSRRDWDYGTRDPLTGRRRPLGSHGAGSGMTSLVPPSLPGRCGPRSSGAVGGGIGPTVGGSRRPRVQGPWRSTVGDCGP